MKFQVNNKKSVVKFKGEKNERNLKMKKHSKTNNEDKIEYDDNGYVKNYENILEFFEINLKLDNFLFRI